jgi:hypothetical protein
LLYLSFYAFAFALIMVRVTLAQLSPAVKGLFAICFSLEFSVLWVVMFGLSKPCDVGAEDGEM